MKEVPQSLVTSLTYPNHLGITADKRCQSSGDWKVQGSSSQKAILNERHPDLLIFFPLVPFDNFMTLSDIIRIHLTGKAVQCDERNDQDNGQNSKRDYNIERIDLVVDHVEVNGDHPKNSAKRLPSQLQRFGRYGGEEQRYILCKVPNNV
eukprot:gb/GECG01011209.1/.p1 GENE.gb/GECG01011209.1/~~gb/GECG01011209.1/.p1  ORF type:complete len:150 (+),score=12.11 gb/GECG01011209.1/:1-450(+)